MKAKLISVSPWLLCGLAFGQISALKGVIAPASAEKAPDAGAKETVEAARARLEGGLKEARETLARIELPTYAGSMPEGIEKAELDDRRRVLEQMIPALTRAIKNAGAVVEAQKALETARKLEQDWTGFSEAPPYSLLLLDDLLNEKDAVKLKLASHQSAYDNFANLLASTTSEAKNTEEELNRMIGRLPNANEKEALAIKWRMEALRAKVRLYMLRVGSLETSWLAHKELIAADERELALVDRKIKKVEENAGFDRKDLLKTEEAIEQRKRALHKEIDAVSKVLKAAIATRTQQQVAWDGLNAQPPAANAQVLDLAKTKLEVAESKVEAAQSLTEGLELIVQLENLALGAYRGRYTLLDPVSADSAKKQALTSLVESIHRLGAWENVLKNEIEAAGATLEQLEARVTSLPEDDVRRGLLSEQRAMLHQKMALLQRLQHGVGTNRKLLRRWELGFSPELGSSGLWTQIKQILPLALRTVQQIWGFEITSIDKMVPLDGKIITIPVAITLGLVVRALLFLVIGYALVALLLARFQQFIVRHQYIGEGQARTLRNWVMILALLMLVMGTLSFLDIPLTVFAFFGGALAIGLGFGTQTLIKNFISGIIVLVERKIRVGDVLNVDGVVGVVTEVNTRSSIIRGGDDAETLIPNSLFLEHRVTNLTLSNSKVRHSLRVGVAYGNIPQSVMEILTASASRHGLICKDPQPYAVFDDFGDNALMFSLYFWVEVGKGTSATITASDLRIMIEKQFRETGVSVPYPQREMHLTTAEPLQVYVQQIQPEALKDEPAQ